MPPEECDALLRRAKVLRLGLMDADGPYVVPVNFGYDGERIYVHGAREGRRIAAVAEGARGGFEVDAVWKQNQLISATVRALADSSCRLRYGNSARDVTLRKGETLVWEGTR